MMNQPELTIKKNHIDEHFFYEVNRTTFDQQSSKDVFDHHFNDGLLIEERLFVFSGSDSGLLIDYLLEQKLPEGSQYLFIELDYIEVYIDKTKITSHPQIHLTTQNNWREYIDTLNIHAYLYKNALIHIKSLAALNLYDINYHNLNLSIQEEIQKQLFTAAAQLKSGDFIKQQLMNVTESQNNLFFIKDKFKGLSCIILAAGPSLDAHIEWVRKNRKKIVVLAVSRISAKLIKEKITPDIIFTIDPFDISFTVSREMFLFKSPPILIHSYHATNLITSQWSGQQFNLQDILPWHSPLNKENIRGIGPTVTNTALYVAVEMGFSDIYLAGVDLCFNQEGQSHESSSIESKFKGNTLAKINEIVDTYDGRKAETTIQYKFAAYTLNDIANEAKVRSSHVFNLSEAAIQLSNIDFIAIKEINLPHIDVSEKMSIFSDINNISSSTEHLNNVKKELLTAIKNIKEIKLLAESAIEHNKKLFKNKGNESANFSHKIKMDKIEKKLTNKYKIFNDFMKSVGIAHFISCINAQESNEWSDELVKLTAERYYQAYINTYNDIMPVLESSYKRILSRINECSSSADLKAIVQQWKDDKHFSRINAIKYKNTKLYNLIQTQIPDDFDELNTLSDSQLTEITGYEKTLKKKSTTKNIKQKIILRFKQKDINSLTQMLSNLTALKDDKAQTDDILTAYYTTKAYLSFLHEAYLETLNAFEFIAKEKLADDDYILIAQCAMKLKKTELAESTFERLSTLNVNYLPKLAQIQKINGKNQQAIESYSDYLAQKPSDIFQWLSLSKLLITLEQYDAATNTLQCVLKQDPENETAKKILANVMKNSRKRIGI